MKKIKIRYIEERYRDDGIWYTLQIKKIFFWIDIKYRQCLPLNDNVQKYRKKTKEELFKIVMEDYFKINKTHMQIIEFPSIIKY
ncbi:MAG: hypothetical protein WC390_07345 [Sulfurimonas sp.]|jgi:hypothetical protein